MSRSARLPAAAAACLTLLLHAGAIAQTPDWYVIWWGNTEVPCAPLPALLPGAHTPQQALDILRRGGDPKSTLQAGSKAKWIEVIHTEGETIGMVNGTGDCRLWAAYSAIR